VFGTLGILPGAQRANCVEENRRFGEIEDL